MDAKQITELQKMSKINIDLLTDGEEYDFLTDAGPAIGELLDEIERLKKMIDGKECRNCKYLEVQ